MTDKIRKTPVAHIDVLKADIIVSIPIDSMNMDSLKTANAVLDKIRTVIHEAAAHGIVTTRLGRAPGNLFP